MTTQTRLQSLHEAAVQANRAFGREVSEGTLELRDLERGKMALALRNLVQATDGSESPRQILDAFRDAYRACGAPGDFGYGTPFGDALKDLYNAWCESRRNAEVSHE